MGKQLRVLIVEDSMDDTLLLLRELRQGGYEPAFERVDTPEAMSAALDQQQWDIVISDYVMPQFNGLAALELLRARGIDLPFIVVSGKIGEDVAVQTMKAGAHDYILKDNLARLAPAVEREMGDAEVRRERRKAAKERDRLMEQLRKANEQLVVSSIRIQEQADRAERTRNLDALLSMTLDHVYVYDQAGRYTYVNPVAAKALGVSPADMIGRTWRELGLPKEIMGPLDVQRENVFRGDQPMTGEITLGPSTDAKRYEYTLAPVHGVDGNVVAVVAIVRDTTGRVLSNKR